MKITTFSHYKSFELEQMNEYHLRFLEAIENNIQGFYKQIEQDFRAKYGNSDDDEFYEALGDEISSQTSDYDFTLYSAFIMAIYSFLEQTLNQICKHHEKALTSNIKLSDLRGDGVERAYLFLTKIVGANKEELNILWSQVQDLNKIRNLVVHQGISEIKDFQNDNFGKQITCAKKLGLFKTFPLNSKDPYYGRLFLNYDYCKLSLKNIEEFLFLLLKKLPDTPLML